MSANRASTIERILNGIENYVEDWRKENAARQDDAEANRDELWAEAAERERLLREAVNEEESRQDSLEEVTKRCRVVFVLHSEEVAGTLEDFAAARDRLVKVIPGGDSSSTGSGAGGSWLVFEESG